MKASARESYLDTIRKLRTALDKVIDSKLPRDFRHVIATTKVMGRCAADFSLPSPVRIIDPFPLTQCPPLPAPPLHEGSKIVCWLVVDPTMKIIWRMFLVDNGFDIHGHPELKEVVRTQDGTGWALDALKDWEFDVEHWPQAGQVRDIARGFAVSWKDHLVQERLKELMQYAAVHGAEKLRRQRPKIYAKYRQAKITTRWILGAADFFIHYLNDEYWERRTEDEAANADMVHRYYMEARELKPSLKIPGKDRIGRHEAQAEMERLKTEVMEVPTEWLTPYRTLIDVAERFGYGTNTRKAKRQLAPLGLGNPTQNRQEWSFPTDGLAPEIREKWQRGRGTVGTPT